MMLSINLKLKEQSFYTYTDVVRKQNAESPKTMLQHSSLDAWKPRVDGSDERAALRFIETWKSVNPTHSSHPLTTYVIYYGSGPPTCHKNGWYLFCISIHTHTFNFHTKAHECVALVWAAISLRWRRRASVFNVFTQGASHSVCRLEDPDLMQ